MLPQLQQQGGPLKRAFPKSLTPLENLERAKGFEPSTPTLASGKLQSRCIRMDSVRVRSDALLSTKGSRVGKIEFLHSSELERTPLNPGKGRSQ